MAFFDWINPASIISNTAKALPALLGGALSYSAPTLAQAYQTVAPKPAPKPQPVVAPKPIVPVAPKPVAKPVTVAKQVSTGGRYVTPRPVALPVQIPQFNPAQIAAQSVLPPGGVQTPTLFSKVLPRESVINQNLINQLAFSRVNPEVDRLKAIGFQNLMNQLASQGGLRFGQAAVDQQNLADQYERQRKEMAQPFINEGLNRLSDYYNTLQTEYYKDPNAFQYQPLNVQQYLGY